MSTAPCAISGDEWRTYGIHSNYELSRVVLNYEQQADQIKVWIRVVASVWLVNLNTKSALACLRQAPQIVLSHNL